MFLLNIHLYVLQLLLSARTAMWSMPVVLTETENENDSVNQNYIAKMTSQCRMETAVVFCTNPLILLCDMFQPKKMSLNFIFMQQKVCQI